MANRPPEYERVRKLLVTLPRKWPGNEGSQANPIEPIYLFLLLRFQRLNFHQTMSALLKEFLRICRQEKKWLLIPLLLLLLILGLGAFFLFASSSGVSWALYPSK